MKKKVIIYVIVLILISFSLLLIGRIKKDISWETELESDIIEYIKADSKEKNESKLRKIVSSESATEKIYVAMKHVRQHDRDAYLKLLYALGDVDTDLYHKILLEELRIGGKYFYYINTNALRKLKKEDLEQMLNVVSKSDFKDSDVWVNDISFVIKNLQ